MAARDQAGRVSGHRPQKAVQVSLYSRPGNDLTYRFPLIVETLARLRSRSCIIDGEAVACDDNGITTFVYRSSITIIIGSLRRGM
jgi:ATP-dependent DNA ligase